jgi:pyruvate kinase
MIDNGMNVARVDLSLGSNTDNLQLLETLKKALRLKTGA